MQMATSVNEILENSSVSEYGVLSDSCAPEVLQNHGVQLDSQTLYSEEVKGALDRSASIGKFWLDWGKLKSILSYHLKQVLSQYPEATMSREQQITSLGETFEEVLERLDHALHSFDEGPPFTLQRLCEILLSPKSMYPKLSKLSFALEKNLLVTSILTISTDTFPIVTEQNSNGTHEESVVVQHQPMAADNGAEEPCAGNRDGTMSGVAETDEDMTMDMETIEDIVRSSEPNPTPTQSTQRES